MVAQTRNLFMARNYNFQAALQPRKSRCSNVFVYSCLFVATGKPWKTAAPLGTGSQAFHWWHRHHPPPGQTGSPFSLHLLHDKLASAPPLPLHPAHQGCTCSLYFTYTAQGHSEEMIITRQPLLWPSLTSVTSLSHSSPLSMDLFETPQKRCWWLAWLRSYAPSWSNGKGPEGIRCPAQGPKRQFLCICARVCTCTCMHMCVGKVEGKNQYILLQIFKGLWI